VTSNALQAALALAPVAVPAPVDGDARLRIIEYYSEAGPDFAAWSPSYNMHFGYFRAGINPFRLEAMLEAMNDEVLARLDLDPARPCRILDLGCGLGATARQIARSRPRAAVAGVTIVPWQADEARRLTRDAGLDGRVDFVEADFAELPWPDGTFDGAIAIESACHAKGPGKAELLREAARVLKPGAKLVVADLFRNHDRELNPLLRACDETFRRAWRVGSFAELGEFRREAARSNLDGLRAERVSWRIAPSALFVPLVTARFLFQELVVRRRRLTPRRWDTVIASLLGMVLGAAPSAFGYYLMTARKGSLTPAAARR
jgi:ubiquinone/menaquinone biosynthesis C-methylase UbiE